MNQTTALTLVLPSPFDAAQVVTDEEPLTALEERQNLLAHHVRLLARGMSVGLFVYGSQGGLGKSRTVLRTLADEGISPVLVNSHITPLSLYMTLYFNRTDRIIFFDDVDSIFGSMAHLGLLRSRPLGHSSNRHLRFKPTRRPARFVHLREQDRILCECRPSPERRIQGCALTMRHLPVERQPRRGFGADAKGLHRLAMSP